MKLYLAGPDVFRPDVLEWASASRTLCRRYGHEALIPVDHGETSPARIFQANLALICEAQIVIANLNPFRGAEPDSGTCVEIGYALALEKQVYGYLACREPLLARVNRSEGADPARTHDDRGMSIENFGLPLNLMLAVPARIVEGDLEDCLRQLRDGDMPPLSPLPAAGLPENPVARRSIEAAIRYLRWVAAGRISDHQALATIAGHYKVDSATVEYWSTALVGVDLAVTSDYLPDDVTRQMKIGGRQFRSL